MALLSGLKYVGLPIDALGVAAVVILVAATVVAIRSANVATFDAPAILEELAVEA